MCILGNICACMEYMFYVYIGNICACMEYMFYVYIDNTCACMLQIPLGLGSACTARIGQYLGANDPNGAVNVSRVTIVITST